MKNKFVSDYRPNEPVDNLFLVSRKEIRPKKTGGDYMFTVLNDRTGSLPAFLWDNIELFRNNFEAGDFVHVLGVTKDYNRSLQVTVHKIKRVPQDQVEVMDFIRGSDKNPDETFQAFITLLQSEVTLPPLRQLLLNIFGDPDLVRRFKECPAAKALHHAYIGGLMEHTLSVMRLCVLVASHYPMLNRSLLLAGAALHDVGKMDELAWGRSFEYTDEGRLVGHITMESIFLDRKMSEIPDFPPELRIELLHILISHHRELEYGSPKRPKTLEALVLSYLDDLDAKLESFREAMSQPGESENWTAFNQNMQRFLYKHRIEDPQP